LFQFPYNLLHFFRLSNLIIYFIFSIFLLSFQVSFCNLFLFQFHINGVDVSVLSSSVIHPVFELQSDQTKDFNIGIYCFSANANAKHAALTSKSKDWLARNENSLCEWNDMSYREFCVFSQLAI